MTESEHAARGASAAGGGDPLRDLILGFTTNIDQLAALIGGNRDANAAAGPDGLSRIGELAGELGTMIGDLGDLLARILSALVAVLEAIVQMLRSGPASTTSTGSAFEPIPVRITTT